MSNQERLSMPAHGRSGWVIILLALCSLVLSLSSVTAQPSDDALRGMIIDQPPAFAEPVQPDRYLVRPGDTLIVTFINAQLSSRRFVVTVDGSIVDQVLGRISAGGRMLDRVRESLGRRLAEAYRVEEFDISVSGPLRLAMTVSGQVANPGVYSAYSSQRVSELISQAGGLARGASERNILLIGPTDTFTVDLVAAFRLGEPDANPFLAAGSRIYVPARSQEVVAVQGEVRYPTEIELKAEDGIDRLLAIAGGLTERADSTNMVIIRNGDRLPVNRDQLKTGDVLFVPRDDDYAHMVTLFGAVASPGRYRWTDGLILSDLLSRAGGITEEAVAERVTVFRRSSSSSSRRYPVQASAASAGLTLQPLDSVVVPEQLGYVRVTGEVRNPGYYPHQLDRSARFYVEAAGGYLATADRTRVVRTNRVSGLSSDVSPDALVFDGDVITVPAKEERP